MPIAPGQTIGPYHIESKLGEGGMGAVYKAQQAGVNRTVVVKVLTANFKDNPQMLDRFKRELDIIAQLEHPYILPVYDFGEAEGNPYIVMRYMGGGSLLDVLTNRTFTRDQLLRVLEQLAEALDYAHDRHIIHRDLKPANVLLDDRGNAYLADFGLARTLEGSSELTKTGSILGTPAYMSPEQGRGEKLDQRSDIYSLGIMAFEALAGQAPFQAETSWKLISKHLTEPPPSITFFKPDLPQAVEEVINQALSKDKNLRPARAGDFVKALRAALASTTGAAAGPTNLGAPAASLAQLNARNGAPRTANVVAPATGMPVSGTPARSAAGQSAQSQPRAQSTTSLPRTAAVAIPIVLVLGLALVAVIIIAAVGLYAFRDKLFPPQVATYSIGTAPRALTFDGQDLWVASGVGQFVARVHATGCDAQPDPCGKASATYPADSLVTGIAYDGSNIWLANGLGLTLTKLDRASGELVATSPLPNVPSNLYFGGGFLWVTSSQSGHLIKIGPDGSVAADFSLDGGPLAMTFASNNLWVTTEVSQKLLQIDPQSGTVLNSVAIDGATEVNALAFDGHNIWVALQDKNEVLKVDPLGFISAHVAVGSGPVAVTFGGGAIWVANRGSGTVSRIDPNTNAVTATLNVSQRPYALTYTTCGTACGDLWIIDVENDVLQRARVK